METIVKSEDIDTLMMHDSNIELEAVNKDIIHLTVICAWMHLLVLQVALQEDDHVKCVTYQLFSVRERLHGIFAEGSVTTE